MALKVDYMVRETAINLARNISLTVATVLTVVLSLSLVGSVLVLRQGVDNATARWQGGIEFIVFMEPDATSSQIAGIGQALAENPQVERTTYVDHEETYEEFVRLFEDSPQLISTVEPEILPPSYRVVPVDKSASVVLGLQNEFVDRSGVRDAVAAEESIRTIEDLSDRGQFAMFVAASFALLAAVLLIGNTIRMAMIARRREIEVMKLVGASNWFIRIPYMLEGIAAGVIGSAISVGIVVAFERALDRIGTGDFTLLAAISVTTSQLQVIAFSVVGLGIGLGALGAAIALIGFLDV